MKKIEKEEVSSFAILTLHVTAQWRPCVVQEDLAYEDPDRKLYHLCIVNLVIG